jgi:hypothetical protein
MDGVSHAYLTFVDHLSTYDLAVEVLLALMSDRSIRS